MLAKNPDTRLTLDFSPQENPFEEDRDKGLVWGKIALDVRDTSGQVIKSVVNMVWDVKEFIEWILENEWFLYNEEYPAKYIVGGDSVAEYRDRYYETRPEDEIDDVADDILWGYTYRHGIHWGMSDVEVDHAYIGLRNGEYEISYYADENENWKYNIDLGLFIDDAKNIKNKYFPG
jgi:hypothetical protein